MARIAGINIPTNKRVEISLTYIHGIGRTKAVEICDKVAIPRERRVTELTLQKQPLQTKAYWLFSVRRLLWCNPLFPTHLM